MLRDLLKTLGHLAFARYDAVLDMEFFSNFSSLVAFLTNAPLRVGFFLRRSFRERVLTRTVYYNSAQHISDAYLALGRAIGVGGSGDPSTIRWVRDEDRPSLARLLEGHGVGPSERIVVFNVNASDLCLERRWPRDRFAELCRRIRAEAPIRPIFIGTRAQRDYVASVVSAVGDPSCLNLAGETDFGGLLSLLERAALIVGNDSGPLHVAEALGRPIVALYGPESPVHYGMRLPNAATYFANLYCSPCLNAANVKVAPCGGDNLCMRSIPVEDVFRGALLLLRGEPLPPQEAARWNGYGGKFARTDWLSPAPGDGRA
jgi:ADP-heptose:LPS heptosyltransferase